MTSIELANRLLEANVRIEGIWPIPNGEVPDAMLEAFEYYEQLPPALLPFVKGWDEAEVEQLFEGEGYQSREAWSELFSAVYCAGTPLYVLRASNPVFTRTGENSCSFSWGHYSSDLFVGETPEAAMDAAIAWAEANYAKVRGKVSA